MTEMEAGSGGAMDQPVPPARRKKPSARRSRLARWLIWIGIVLAVVVAAVGTTVAILLHRAEPMMRASLIDTLQKRFHSRVELDDLRVSILDGFWVESRGLRIWLPPQQQDTDSGTTQPAGTAQPDDTAQSSWRTKPWIIVGKMKFHASWRILPGKPIVVSVIHIEDVRVLLPPKEDRPHMSMPGGNSSESKPTDGQTAQTDQTAQDASQPQSQGGSKPSIFKLPPIEVGKIECQTAELMIERKQEVGKPPKVPLDFELQKITLIPDRRGGPIAFTVDMVNAKPVGKIHSTGHFGPWVSGDPGSLPLQGEYTFDHADLGTIKGIAGTLSSTGNYSGTLRRIEAEGQTRTPNFRLERVDKSSGVPLTTHFHAIIDGTNGDTYLQPVDGMLGHTHILARGQVVRASDLVAGAQGHDIHLQVTVDRGKIEDILDISANSEAPFMTGNLTLNTSFHLPPGKDSIWDKLQLDGQFHLSQARFTNDKMQGRIEQLSLRGQGKPKEVKTTDPTDILSEMQGHFQLGGGNLQLPDLDYNVPGAEIVAHGTYGLKAGTLAFEGDAKLDATISKIVGGWKGFLLKPADRYLRKNGAGTDVPIHVTGTRKEPKFGVDFDRLGKNDKTQQSQEPE
jgi:AsmA-like C-terminal region